MKRAILNLIACLFLLCACQKGKCKEQQTLDLQKELVLFQKAVSNTNLTTEQINEITKRHNEKNKQIMAQCN